MTLIDELKSLNELRDKGNLTDQEYADAKAATLNAQEVGAGFRQNPSGLSPTLTAVLLVVLGIIGLAGVFWYEMGTKNTTTLIATAIHAPITLTDEVENLRAHSLKAVEFNMPYDGTLDVTLSVAHGNPIDVLVTTPDQLDGLDKMTNWPGASAHYAEFGATKTKLYKRSGQLPKGDYYLVLRDPSLGILSASASDISIKAEVKP